MGGSVPYPNEAPVSANDIRDMQQAKKFFYMWGWVRYFDGFPGTPERITRFCWLILPSPTDPFAFNPALPATHIAFSNLSHSEGNCADDECPY
jgi:hypothetical protein